MLCYFYILNIGKILIPFLNWNQKNFSFLIQKCSQVYNKLIVSLSSFLFTSHLKKNDGQKNAQILVYMGVTGNFVKMKILIWWAWGEA